MIEDCGICKRIEQIKQGRHERLVAELGSGYAVLLDNQAHQGITLFLSKVCARELHELEPPFRAAFLEDMTTVARAVESAFGAAKMNYELLGNSEPHLHWWLVPRYADEPNPRFPIWSNAAFIDAYNNAMPDDPAQVRDSIERLRVALDTR